MTFGRPTMISDAWNVQAPAMIDDEYLLMEGEGFQPAHLSSRMGLFVYSSKLFEVLNEVLSAVYTKDAVMMSSKQNNPETRSQKMLMKVVGFNRRLDKFIASIPEYLRPMVTSNPQDQQKENYIKIQEKVLYCRYVSLNPTRSIACVNCHQISLHSSTFVATDPAPGYRRGGHELERGIWSTNGINVGRKPFPRCMQSLRHNGAQTYPEYLPQPGVYIQEFGVAHCILYASPLARND